MLNFIIKNTIIIYMTEQERINKNLAIKITKHETSIKRQYQVCNTYTCKVQMNRLSKLQQEQLKMMFVEAKWLYNDILYWSNEKEENTPFNYKIGKTVKHKDKNGNVIETEMKYLHSQMKQCVQNKICNNIKTLSTLKKTK